MRGFVTRLRDRIAGRRLDRESDDEIAFHIEMETEKLARDGVDPAEARRRALVAFGGAKRTRERLREGRALPFFDAARSDLRFALGALRRAPGPALVAIVSIGLGVGGSTAVFSAANGLLEQDLPVPTPERMVRIGEVRSGRSSGGIEGSRIPYTRYLSYEERTRSLFTAFAAHRPTSFSVRLDDETHAIAGDLVSGNYFEAAAITPLLGRFFRADEDAEAVVGARFWRERMGSDAAVIGSTIHVDSRPFVVVGVAPEGYTGLTPPLVSEMWIPAVAHRPEGTDEASAPWVATFGRVRDDVDHDQVAAAVEVVGLGLEPASAGTTVHSVRVERMTSLPDMGVTLVVGFFGMLLGLAMLVLLIASANVGGMMLARSLARRREIAIRLAVGAGRGRLVRHLMAEALVLFAIGGGLGVGIAYVVAGLLESVSLPQRSEFTLVLDVTPDVRVLTFALVLTGLTGVLFSLIPALQASRPDLVPALREGGRGSVTRARGRDVFVGGQVASAVLLLLIATLFGRSLQRSLDTELGFDYDGVVLAHTDLAPHGYDAARGFAFYEELLEQASGLPGVSDVGLSQTVLVSGDRNGWDVIPDDEDENGDRRANASTNVATPGMLATGGYELVAGRWFDEGDRGGAPPVAVINETLADRLWRGGSAVGRIVRMGANRREVVGVLRDGTYQFMLEGTTPYLYTPFAQDYRQAMTLHVRAPGREAETHRAVVELVRRIGSNVAVEGAATHAEVLDLGLLPQRVAVGFVGLFGLVGLALAAIGVYGVLAFHVAQRGREFGVRRALGAPTGRLLREVLWRGVALAGVGCLIGSALGAGVAQLVESYLAGLSPLDPATFIGVPLLLLAVAVAASLVPALRATSVAAVDSLRSE